VKTLPLGISVTTLRYVPRVLRNKYDGDKSKFDFVVYRVDLNSLRMETRQHDACNM